MAKSRSPLDINLTEDPESPSKRSNGLFAKICRGVTAVVLLFKSDESKYDNVKLKEIPGKQRTSLLDFYLFKKKGLPFFSEKIDQYQSRVFRFPLGKPSTIICDVDAICDNFCDASEIFKEPTFGGKTVNLGAIGKHVPCIFTNDFVHSKRKAFLLGFANLVENLYLLPALVEVVPKHLETWCTEGLRNGDDEFEENITKLMAEVYSKSFLGIELDYEWIQEWNKHIFKHTSDMKHLKETYNYMYFVIKNCPRYEEMLVIASKYKISAKEMINEVIFAILFNAIPTTANVMISAVGRLVCVSKEILEQLKNEMANRMQRGLERRTVSKLTHLENFVLEVMRLTPPIPLIYGTVRSMHALFSSSGNFTINEGDVLVGNVYDAQRDPEIFNQPNLFDPSRFIDEYLKDSVLSFGGRLTDEPKSSDRKCPGQEISLTILKVCLLNLMECGFKLKEEAIFEDKCFQRFGRPDKPLSLAYFDFNLPCWWKLREEGYGELYYSGNNFGNSGSTLHLENRARCRGREYSYISLKENSERISRPGSADGCFSEHSCPFRHPNSYEYDSKSQRSFLNPKEYDHWTAPTTQSQGSSLSEVEID